MSGPRWHSRANRAARELEIALGIRKRGHGGKRPGAGRKQRFFLHRPLGVWNRSAIVDAMLHALSVNPFGRDPFAQVPGEPRPSVQVAAMLVELLLRDRASYARLTEDILAGGSRKRRALVSLRAARRATAPADSGAAPTWRTCQLYYRRHLAAGGTPNYNDESRLAMHRAVPSE